MTKQVQIIDQKILLVEALDPTKKFFIVYITYLKGKISIYPVCEIIIALLVTEKVIILAQYSNFTDVFFKKLAAELLECFNINKHSIGLNLGKQLSYKLIYNLDLIKIKILKTYIKTNLINNFIYSFRSLAKPLILFIQTPDSIFYLYKNYWGLNNLTIKNWYSLPLISELLDCLGQIRQFIQLDLKNAYY